MKKKSISSAIAKWDKNITIAQFARDELAQFDANRKTKGSNVIDNLYKLTTIAESDSDKIKAAELLLKTASLDEKKPDVQINQQFNLSAWAENLK